MNDKSLTTSFGESISQIITDPIVDTAEVILDSFLEEGILKDLPVIKYAVTAYKIVDDVKGRFYIAKLRKFINSFNRGLATPDEVEKYKERFTGKKHDSELAYILVVLDKYLDLQKPEILSKLYLAYLDGKIDMDELCAYAETLDRILIKDLKCLFAKDEYTIATNTHCIPAELLRLTGVGLMYSYQNDSVFRSDGRGGMAVFAEDFSRIENKERIYTITEFGMKLKIIVNEVQ